MNDETSADVGAQIETMQRQVESLVKRVTDLESTLRHEHKDLVALKEVSDQDHRELRNLQGASGLGLQPPSATPLGL